MKNKFLALSFLILLSSFASAQILRPAKFSQRLSKTENIKPGDVIEIIFEAKISKSWHLYSNDFDPNLGPLLIEFDFEKNKSYKLMSVKPKAINAKKHYDKIWEGEVSYFENTAKLRQKIKVVKLPLIIEGTIDFQTCSTTSGQCVMGDHEFLIKVK
ncbi:MAG: protein-disulfide reductase DsbD N-terminal domain-containing protein [Marinifilaceae bacterium]|jgi:thiol:disulfide interchange protein DsbD|nr:protein-disulfide reductase DsbD N-terminal domain-containing protein [Marinifilaceae bacterium]